MQVFRVINFEDLKPEDFDDLPFWVHSEGKRIWVSLKHTDVGGHLYDSVTLQLVKENKAGPAWNHFSTKDNYGLLWGVGSMVADQEKAIFFFTPAELYELECQPKYRRLPTRSRCECEVDMGEPCYCSLR